MESFLLRSTGVLRVERDAERTKGIAKKAVPSLEHGVLVDMF